MGIISKLTAWLTGETSLQPKKTDPEAVTKATGSTPGVGAGLAAGLPGGWASDHRAEAERFVGWQYIAVHALGMQAAQADVEAFVDGANRGPAKSRRKSLRSVYGSISRYRTSAAKSTYGADDRETTPLDPEHRLSRLLSRPNPFETGATFRYRCVQQLRLTGTCHIWNVPARDGLTCQRYVIPTAIASPVAPSADLPLGGYRISPAASRFSMTDDQGFTEMPGIYRLFGKVVDAREVQTIRLPHPVLVDDGQSPLAAGALWIDGSNQVDQARFSQLRNGADPSLVWVLPKGVDPDEDEMERIAKKIGAKYCGVDKSGKVLVAQYETAVTKLSTAPTDMGYSEGFNEYKAASLALHQTPPVAVGLQEPGAYAAYYASMKAYRDGAVQPTLDLLAESDTETLAPQFGTGITVELTASSIEDADLTERQLANDLNARAITRDEWRSRRGLPPVGPERGGDEWVGQAPVQAQPLGVGALDAFDLPFPTIPKPGEKSACAHTHDPVEHGRTNGNGHAIPDSMKQRLNDLSPAMKCAVEEMVDAADSPDEILAILRTAHQG